MIDPLGPIRPISAVPAHQTRTLWLSNFFNHFDGYRPNLTPPSHVANVNQLEHSFACEANYNKSGRKLCPGKFVSWMSCLTLFKPFTVLLMQASILV